MERAEGLAEKCRRVVDGVDRADEASVEEHEVLLAAKACGDEHPAGWVHVIAVIASGGHELWVAWLLTSWTSCERAALAIGSTAGLGERVGTCDRPLVHQGEVAAAGQVGDEHLPTVVGVVAVLVPMHTERCRPAEVLRWPTAGEVGKVLTVEPAGPQLLPLLGGRSSPDPDIRIAIVLEGCIEARIPYRAGGTGGERFELSLLIRAVEVGRRVVTGTGCLGYPAAQLLSLPAGSDDRSAGIGRYLASRRHAVVRLGGGQP